jgi:hypothetical protein
MMGQSVIVGHLWSSCSSDKEYSTTNSQPSLECCLDSENEDAEDFKDALEWSEGPMFVEMSDSEGTNPESVDRAFRETWEFIGGPGAGESHL